MKKKDEGPRELVGRTLSRVKEILQLRDDYVSENTLRHLVEIYAGWRLAKRQSASRTRKNLSRLEKAAIIIVETLGNFDEKGYELLLLRTDDAAYDVQFELARAAAFRDRVKYAMAAVSRPDHGASRSELIRVLALFFKLHLKKRPTKSNEFVELVSIILDLDDPSKEIGEALWGKSTAK